MANQIAMAICAACLVLSVIILFSTLSTQAFIVELLGQHDLPPEITFVQPSGDTVYCQQTENGSEYVCRRDR